MKKGSESETKPKAKHFKPDTTSFLTMKPGQVIEGFFLGARHQTITDQRTKADKDLFVLRLRDTSNPDIIHKIPCAALMFQAWNDLVDEYGNGDENSAIESIRGKRVSILRGDDIRTKMGNPMGSYEIVVWEE
jgi:hypothetical protein